MKCEDVGCYPWWGTGMGIRLLSGFIACHESWMTWHEGMLSVGYEIRRLTGKLDLTGTTWVRGWTESWHVDLRSLIMMSLIMMRTLGVKYKKMSQSLGTFSYILWRWFTLPRIVVNTFATSISHCYSFFSLRRGMCRRKEMRTKRCTEWVHWDTDYP